MVEENELRREEDVISANRLTSQSDLGCARWYVYIRYTYSPCELLIHSYNIEALIVLHLIPIIPGESASDQVLRYSTRLSAYSFIIHRRLPLLHRCSAGLPMPPSPPSKIDFQILLRQG
jgi:hypothetical protein